MFSLTHPNRRPLILRGAKELTKMNEDKSKSYNDGFETGLNWKRDFRPGGPYVPSQSLHRGDAYNASVEAARIAAREWFEGFNAGLAKQKKSQ